MADETLDEPTGGYTIPDGQTPVGFIRIEKHDRTVGRLSRRIDLLEAELAELRQHIMALELNRDHKRVTALATLMQNDRVTNAIAVAISWVGKALAGALLISALGLTGYQLAYGDLSIGADLIRDVAGGEAVDASPIPLPAPTEEAPGAVP